MRKRNTKELAQSSDIAFLLIIFFLLLAGIESGKALTLSSETQETTKQAETCFIVLHQDGSVTENNNPLTTQELSQRLTSSSGCSISVDGETPWQTVVDILSLAEQAGTKVAIHETT